MGVIGFINNNVIPEQGDISSAKGLDSVYMFPSVVTFPVDTYDLDKTVDATGEIFVKSLEDDILHIIVNVCIHFGFSNKKYSNLVFEKMKEYSNNYIKGVWEGYNNGTIENINCNQLLVDIAIMLNRLSIKDKTEHLTNNL